MRTNIIPIIIKGMKGEKKKDPIDADNPIEYAINMMLFRHVSSTLTLYKGSWQSRLTGHQSADAASSFFIDIKQIFHGLHITHTDRKGKIIIPARITKEKKGKCLPLLFL